MKAEYVNHMGDDLAVVNAARVSFDKTSEWLPSGAPSDYPGVVYQTVNGHPVNLKEADAKLISYLARHNHWTPFAHTSITLRMQAPLPIRTQCFKHKFGFVENEESRRYISGDPRVFYPKVWRRAADNVKQGSSEEPCDTKIEWMFYGNEYESRNVSADEIYNDVTGYAVFAYERLIKMGVCPEQARFVLPQGVEVQWIWTGSLAAYARFYRQRTDPHAQKETQELARMVGEIIQPLFPVSWKALTHAG